MDYKTEQLLDTYMPDILSCDGKLVKRSRYNVEQTEITIDMVRLHMAARIEKWLREAPRHVSADEVISFKARHIRIDQIVGDDHLYWRRVMKHDTCPVCYGSTKIGVDLIC